MAGVLDLGVMYALLFISIYFEVFLLMAFIEQRLRRHVRIELDEETMPTVAIAVPCHNEAKTLSATVCSLLSLDYPSHKLEVIVVDDGSSDETLAVARGYEADPRVKVFHKQNGGKSSAMNLALLHTNAELIGCLDADSVVDTGALREMVSVFQNNKVAAATPGIHVNKPENILQHMQHVEYRLSIFNRFVLAALGSAFITPGPFSLFRTSVVKRLGGWRQGYMTEDMEMALRVQASGYLIGNVPAATVYTTVPRTLRHLFRQRVRWNYGWIRNAIDYKYMFGNKKFGNLGMFVLPAGAVLFISGMYFFSRILYFNVREALGLIERVYATGLYPHPSFELFYLNTSALWFLIYLSVLLIFALLCAGSMIGTNDRLPPKTTPLFVLYSFLVPIWLAVAVYRATFRTGVKWR